MLRPQILAHALAQPVVSATRIVRAIEVVVQQEMDGSDAGDLAGGHVISIQEIRLRGKNGGSVQPIDALAVVLGSEELFDLGYREERAEPLVLVFLADEEADIRVCANSNQPSFSPSNQQSVGKTNH